MSKWMALVLHFTTAQLAARYKATPTPPRAALAVDLADRDWYYGICYQPQSRTRT